MSLLVDQFKRVGGLMSIERNMLQKERQLYSR